MPANASYIAVFYDEDKPKTSLYARYKKIPYSTFMNLSDNMSETKTIELKDDEGKVSTYRIKQTSTFNIITEFENTNYVICYCKKMF